MAHLYFGLKIMTRLTAGFLLSIFLLAGCASASQPINSESMLIKASELSKLSKVLEGFVRYENYPDDISDQDLLMKATQHDPSLLKPFSGYVLKVNRMSKHASVLVCNAEGTRGLLEDAGCSYELDKHLWESENNACVFSVSIEDVCKP